MKNINVTILCAGTEEFPRCSDLLETCPEISILAQTGSMNETGAWIALGRSDILILDEAALEQDSLESVRGFLVSQPSVRSLLIIEKYNKNNILSALSLGIKGVVARGSLFSELTRALTAIYIGDAWVSRMLAEPIRDELVYRDRMAHWAGHSQMQPHRDRMN